jgi:SAM-dependent methyltransferase
MVRIPPELADHPDRLRWNARYAANPAASFAAHPLAVQALTLALPDGPALELAAGPSGGALLIAAAGRQVVVVDASDVALELLEAEATRRRLAGNLTLIQADLAVWRPLPASYALVLCTGYWDSSTDLFPAAVLSVRPGGALAWDALTLTACRRKPTLPRAWCLADDEPAALLPATWQVLTQYEPADADGARRRLLAVNAPTGS